MVFSCEYRKIYKNTYFEEHLRTADSPSLNHFNNFYVIYNENFKS